MMVMAFLARPMRFNELKRRLTDLSYEADL
ncbi:hypothetical protein CFP59_08675 [Streptomyces malaysiensis subsp. malaysiensis]|nr:hypothetical protein CFP59_08675 [Streptomyces sp. M56]